MCPHHQSSAAFKWLQPGTASHPPAKCCRLVDTTQFCRPPTSWAVLPRDGHKLVLHPSGQGCPLVDTIWYCRHTLPPSGQKLVLRPSSPLPSQVVLPPGRYNLVLQLHTPRQCCTLVDTIRYCSTQAVLPPGGHITVLCLPTPWPVLSPIGHNPILSPHHQSSASPWWTEPCTVSSLCLSVPEFV